MNPWPSIPDDVVSWFRAVFANANRQVCERLVNLPNIRETSLDDGLIEALIPDSAPTVLPSGAIVRMDMHNIGGLRRIGGPFGDPPFRARWETADIAMLVFIYRGENLVAKKIGLLQSKRLYPQNNDVDDNDEAGFYYGMNAFIGREDKQAAGALHRQFDFDETCVYGALHAQSDQIASIERLNRDFGEAIYYLFYNPHVVPLAIRYPLQQRVRIEGVPVGCRVFDANTVHQIMAGLPKHDPPTFGAMEAAASPTNAWALETWAADLLLTCKVGQAFDDSRDRDVRYFLERRSGPIGAAIAASITLPEG